MVQEYERAVVFRLGRMLTGKARGPGVFFVIPCIDVYEKIDLRTQTYDVPPQEASRTSPRERSNQYFLDSDEGLCHGVCQCYNVLQGTVLNLITLLTGSAGVRQQHGGLRRGRLQHLHPVPRCRRPQEHSRNPQLGRDPLREVRGGRENTGSCNNVRDSIAMEMKLTLDAATCPWGVLVERVEVKDVRVPEQLQRAMAAEAEAAREARAKVIAAEGEHKASRALKHAADIITESPGALQVLKHFGRQYSILLSAAIPPNPQSHR